MGFSLGAAQYGKSEVRLVTVDRSADRHVLRDLTVSTALRGNFEATHLSGDNSDVVATDTQKNTVFAFARKHGVGRIEDFAQLLARHFVDSFEQVTGTQVTIDEHGWDRIEVGGTPHGHAFSRAGEEKRRTTVDYDGGRPWVVSGLSDLVLLKSAGSEFHGFPRDEYTTLPETDDRILATAVTARWRYLRGTDDWDGCFRDVRTALLETFATQHSLSLQQTLYAMGKAALEARDELGEIRLSLPNKHHFLVDLTPFGLDNDNQVFYAADRPYGLIEATIIRDGQP